MVVDSWDRGTARQKNTPSSRCLCKQAPAISRRFVRHEASVQAAPKSLENLLQYSAGRRRLRAAAEFFAIEIRMLPRPCPAARCWPNAAIGISVSIGNPNLVRLLSQLACDPGNCNHTGVLQSFTLKVDRNVSQHRGLPFNQIHAR